MDAIPVSLDLPQSQRSQYLAAQVEQYREFRDLLIRVARQFKTRKAFAEAIDIDPSRLTRAINKGDFAFNAENCLRLAKVSGESASDILRMANKADVAALIEELYGQQSTLSADERQIVAFIRALPREGREGLDKFIRATTAPQAERAHRRRAG